MKPSRDKHDVIKCRLFTKSAMDNQQLSIDFPQKIQYY